MEEIKMISFDDFQDKYIGKKGTPGRDAFEKKVERVVGPAAKKLHQYR